LLFWGTMKQASERPTEAALELELSTDDLVRLSTATRNRGRAVARAAVIPVLVIGAMLVSSSLYLSWTPAPPVTLAASVPPPTVTPEPPPPAPPPSEPVRFVNPFDATEVFEFPHGTSKTEAREAVASLLIQRARERHSAPDRPVARLIR
jgi:hypothetical protein